MITKPFLIVLLFFSFCKTKSNDSSEIKVIQEITKDEFNNKPTTIIIPSAGCTGCIDEMVLYTKQNFHKMKEVSIIFTSIGDMKLLRLRIGDSILNAKNVYIDTFNTILNTKLSSSYPLLVQNDKGAIKVTDKITSASPELLKIID